MILLVIDHNEYKNEIGIFEQGSRSEPLPCLFRGDICDFSSQVSLLFRYFQKIFVKKICLERKRKNGIFSFSPHKKIFILLLLLTITFKYELKYVVLSPKSVVFANLIIYPSLPLRTRRIVDGFRLGTLGSAVSLPATGHPLLSCSGVNPAKKR